MFGSGTLDGGCFDAAVANDRDDGLNMWFDVMRKSDAIVPALET